MPSIHASGIGQIKKQHGVSLHVLSKWNKQLDNQRQKSMYEQEQIKKEKKLEKMKTQTMYRDISFIQEQAVQLARKFQQEKTKYQKLTILIKSLQSQNYKQKLQKYEDIMNKKQPDEFEEQKKKLEEKEKKLQKILQKLNNSEFQISKKIQLIRSLRSQRTVHSNLFDNLEKQYFDVKFYYKQLLIQRSLMQKQMDKCITSYNNIHQKSRIQVQKISQQIGQQKLKTTLNLQQNNQLQKQQNYRIPTSKNLKVLNQQNPMKSNRSQLIKSNRSLDRNKCKKQTYSNKNVINQNQKNILEIKNNQYKKKVKKILDLLEVESFKQLKHNIDTLNHKSQNQYQKSNEIYEEIFKLQKMDQQLQKVINQRKNIKQNSINMKKTQLKTQINQFQNETNQTKNQIIKFKKTFQSQLLSFVKFFENNQNNSSKQTVSQNFRHSQNSQSSYVQCQQSTNLSFNEIQQKLKLLMVNFNDDLIQFFLKKNKNNIFYRNKLLRKKSLILLKNKKANNLSNGNIQKRVKIMRTQTEGSIGSSISGTMMQNLQAILNMHSIEKVQRNQKVDNLSIMTEQDLIQQSKRIIRQVNKKKSQFVMSNLIKK